MSFGETRVGSSLSKCSVYPVTCVEDCDSKNVSEEGSPFLDTPSLSVITSVLLCFWTLVST